MIRNFHFAYAWAEVQGFDEERADNRWANVHFDEGMAVDLARADDYEVALPIVAHLQASLVNDCH